MLTLCSFREITTNVLEQQHDVERSYATCYPVKLSYDRDCEVINIQLVLFLAHFPYFEKIEQAYRVAVCVSPPPPLTSECLNQSL
jgi:hypothetical protein